MSKNERWALRRQSNPLIPGDSPIWITDNAGQPLTFESRASAREYVQANFGFINERPDLQEQFGFKLPRVVKVRVVLEEVRPDGREARCWLRKTKPKRFIGRSSQPDSGPRWISP